MKVGCARRPHAQTLATDDQISAILRLNACRRVRGTAASSSSGRRSPTTMTARHYDARDKDDGLVLTDR
jgi:hypothetical protein